MPADAGLAGAAAEPEVGAAVSTGPSVIGLSFSSVTMRKASFGPTPLARPTVWLPSVL